jgi:uncharacterized protein YggU (UPF0235/DUF167 family)
MAPKAPKAAGAALSCLLTVRVQPGARATRLSLTPAECKVFLQERAVDGRANAALVEALAEWLAVSRSRVTLVRGHTSRDKVVAVEGLADSEAQARLQQQAAADE